MTREVAPMTDVGYLNIGNANGDTSDRARSTEGLPFEMRWRWLKDSGFYDPDRNPPGPAVDIFGRVR